jgi:hypothetical protein
VHIDGVRAYERARRGETVVVPERTVTVHRFEQRWRDGDRACFVIECSTGTYVRSLIADLHDGYCLELRRTAIGPFTVDDADGETVMPLGDVLAAILPVVALDGEDARRASTVRRSAVAPTARWCWPTTRARSRRRAAEGRRHQARRRVPRVTIAPRRRRAARCRVAIGFFDGVHLGHRAVIAGNDTAVTPTRTCQGARVARAPPLLTTLDARPSSSRASAWRSWSWSRSPTSWLPSRPKVHR